MAKSSTNWVQDKNLGIDKDKTILSKAKRIEENEIEKGWRWVKINERTKVLVECDAKGKPTKRGKELIDRMKAL